MKRFALLAEEDRKEDAGPYRGLGLSEDGEPRLLRRRGHAGLSQQPSCDELVRCRDFVHKVKVYPPGDPARGRQ
jgi:hypothetical protein